MRRATKKNTTKEWPGISSNGNQGSVQENESKNGVRRSQPENKMDRRMAPTEIVSEAPTDGEEWFLGRNARKDRWSEDSESESLWLRSLPVLQPMTGLCFLRHREKWLNDQARRHYPPVYISKHRSGGWTEKRTAVGQGNRTTVRRTGEMGWRVQKDWRMVLILMALWLLLCNWGFSTTHFKNHDSLGWLFFQVAKRRVFKNIFRRGHLRTSA